MNVRLSNDDDGTKKIKEELYGIVEVEAMPFDLQEEMTRNNLNIAPHIWEEYDQKTKGKCISANIIKNNLETIERYEGILSRNRKK